MVEESVAHKTARTSFWGGIEKISGLGIQFVVSMLLARFLTPSDYGVVAMLMVFIAISNQFVSCGFVNALIRKKECYDIDYNTAFYFNLVVSFVFYIILFFAAPYIAQFYKMDILCPVLRACALSVPIGALTLVQSAILQRYLEAKKQAYISLLVGLISGFIAITFAYSGFGVWSLVIHQLISGILNTLCLWYRSRWYPKLQYSIDSMRYLWGFGSKMLLTGIISVTYSNMYSIVIGKFYNSSSLGLFNRGQSISFLLPNVLEGIFVKNSLPIMAQLQDDKERMIIVYRDFVSLACFLTFPVVFLVAILAEPFVVFILTSKWLGCVVFIQIFSLNSLLSPANSVNLNLLQVFGRSDYTLKAEIIKKSTGLILIFILLPYGPLYLAIGSSSFSIVVYWVNLYYAKKLSGLSYWDQVKDMIPILLSCSIMSLVVFLVIEPLESNLNKLIVGGVSGCISYSVLAHFVFKIKIVDKLLEFIKKS